MRQTRNEHILHQRRRLKSIITGTHDQCPSDPHKGQVWFNTRSKRNERYWGSSLGWIEEGPDEGAFDGD